jgi:hypothetical protein
MPDQLKVALIKSIPDLGSALSAPRPRVIDCGVINSLEEAKQAAASTLDCGEILSPETPQDPVEQKVLKFLGICRTSVGLTAREISGGTGLPISDVKVALAALVTAGTVLSDDGYENQRRYTLSSPVTEQPEVPAQQTLNPAEQQLREAAQKHQAEVLAKTPQPKRHIVTDAELDAELAKRKTVTPLTVEERRLLDLGRDRVPINPQSVIRR